jgi:cytochrome oxidase Cu insertion factor (SCO1/SenC/PrrC family)
VNTDFIAGTTLPSQKLAPDFTLTDQSGKQFDLKEMRGHPVLITFMDATCKQECPVTAQYLNWTKQFLGAEDANKIDWIAVSVNPNNTPAQAKAFIAKYKPGVPLLFALGTHQQLSSVWQAYHITVIPKSGDVQHTIVYYLLDKNGHEREIVDQGFDPKQMAHDLRVLLSE